MNDFWEWKGDRRWFDWWISFEIEERWLKKLNDSVGLIDISLLVFPIKMVQFLWKYKLGYWHVYQTGFNYSTDSHKMLLYLEGFQWRNNGNYNSCWQCIREHLHTQILFKPDR